MSIVVQVFLHHLHSSDCFHSPTGARVEPHQPGSGEVLPLRRGSGEGVRLGGGGGQGGRRHSDGHREHGAGALRSVGESGSARGR